MKFIGATLILVVFAAAVPAFAAHYDLAHELSWIDKYKDVNGGLCCGTQDCVEVDAVLLRREGARVLLRINGVHVWFLAGSVHVSEDPNRAYLCPRCAREKLGPSCIRCVFVLPGNT